MLLRLHLTCTGNQARSQKFAMEGQLFWGCRGKVPRRRRHGDSKAKTTALKILRFFFKNSVILVLFGQKLILLKRVIEIDNANMIKLIA